MSGGLERSSDPAIKRSSDRVVERAGERSVKVDNFKGLPNESTSVLAEFAYRKHSSHSSQLADHRSQHAVTLVASSRLDHFHWRQRFQSEEQTISTGRQVRSHEIAMISFCIVANLSTGIMTGLLSVAAASIP